MFFLSSKWLAVVWQGWRHPIQTSGQVTSAFLVAYNRSWFQRRYALIFFRFWIRKRKLWGKRLIQLKVVAASVSNLVNDNGGYSCYNWSFYLLSKNDTWFAPNSLFNKLFITKMGLARRSLRRKKQRLNQLGDRISFPELDRLVEMNYPVRRGWSVIRQLK